jgi:hypothetical protein
MHGCTVELNLYLLTLVVVKEYFLSTHAFTSFQARAAGLKKVECEIKVCKIDMIIKINMYKIDYQLKTKIFV